MEASTYTLTGRPPVNLGDTIRAGCRAISAHMATMANTSRAWRVAYARPLDLAATMRALHAHGRLDGFRMR